MGPVSIVGDGVAALCCTYLLRKAGVAVDLQWRDRTSVPAVMLSDSALHLLRDVFAAPALFADAHRITTREVDWGSGLRGFPHAAVVVSEEDLLRDIGALLPEEPRGGEAEWTVHATREPARDAAIHGFGAHHARAVPVTLDSGWHAASCRIEALPAGWRFLIPTGPEQGWLLTAGEETGFPVHPRLADPVCGPGWLACGTGAVAFNPLCGDGTAHAIREAILAAAVLQAMWTEASEAEMLDLYQERLTAGFARHLHLCRDFYRSGPQGPWWRDQEAAMDAGLAWCASRTRTQSASEFRLDGFTLKRCR